MNEHEFEELMKLEKKQNNDLINKKMKLKMKKNMFSSVVIILICLGLMITVIFYGTSFIVKQFYYNPFHEEEIVDVESENDSRRCDNFNALMATFVEMYFPGFMYSHQGSVEDVKLYDHGFAKYDIKTKIHNTFYDLIWDGTNNTTFTIKRSRMSLDTDVKWFYRYAGEFKGVRDVYDPDAISQKTLQEIKDLPKSALLDVSLSFNDVYSAKETVDFINRYPEVQFVWLGLKGEDSDGIANGMAIKNDVQYFLSEETEKNIQHFICLMNSTKKIC